jgi:hypothetical protein
MPFVHLDFFATHAQMRTPPDGASTSWGRLPLSPTSGMAIPRFTDLRGVRGKRVLFVADSDNWDYSLKPHGLRLRYGKLLNRLKVEAKHVFPVAVLTSARDDRRRARHLESNGWRVVSIPWETIRTCQGTRKLANADMDLAFECGCLSVNSYCNAALIGTGDGDLAVSIARGLRRIHGRTPITIHTLSVVGASSSRLWQRTDLFDSSTMIGEDMLEDIDSQHHFNCCPTAKGRYYAVSTRNCSSRIGCPALPFVRRDCPK